MNLLKMVQIAGLGCSKDCIRQTRFLASLDEQQCADFAHMILSGAKSQLDELKEAAGINVDEKPHGFDPSSAAWSDIGERLAELFQGPRTMDDAPFARRTVFTDMLRKPRVRMSGSLADFLGTDEAGLGRMIQQLLKQTSQPEVEPYSGELTPEQVAAIESLPENERGLLETAIRQTIASRAGGDAEKVRMHMLGYSLYLAQEAAPVSTETAPEATGTDDIKH